jgi:hypothetical protein
MTCANLYFKHDGHDITLSTSGLAVGMTTCVTVWIQNGSTCDAPASCALYWAGEKRNGSIDPPNLIQLQPSPSQGLVPAGGSYPFAFNWDPGTNVSGDPANPNELYLFAQIITEPVASGPCQCGGVWNQNDFDPSKPYNTDQLFQFSLVPTNFVALGLDRLYPGLSALRQRLRERGGEEHHRHGHVEGHLRPSGPPLRPGQ